eukprot:Hpha_TRINITY_DN219_c0_g1::TRINITY_DN219_c0_g1_i1::g.83604::m.83604/K17609/NXN; nucleoredoxin
MAHELLQGLPLIDKQGHSRSADTLQGSIVALYFSAHWCPPCRAFTPRLRAFHAALKQQGAKFEVVFLSSDRSAEEAANYFAAEHGDWLAVPHFAMSMVQALKSRMGVNGIPHLAVVSRRSGGGLIVPPDQARTQVAQSSPQQVYQQWLVADGGAEPTPPAMPAAGGPGPDMSDNEVVLNMYELTGGAAAELSVLSGGDGAERIWFPAVMCYGRECFYDPASGALQRKPGGSRFGEVVRRVTLGKSDRSSAAFTEWHGAKRQALQSTTEWTEGLASACRYAKEAVTFLLGRTPPPEFTDSDLFVALASASPLHQRVAQRLVSAEATTEPVLLDSPDPAPDLSQLTQQRSEGLKMAARWGEQRPTETVRRILGNLLRKPEEAKFRRVRVANKHIAPVAQSPACVLCLMAAGFVYNKSEGAFECLEPCK